MLLKKFKVIFSIVTVFFFVLILYTKFDSYDIINYVDSVSYVFVFEPLYALSIKFINNFEYNARNVILIYQIFLSILMLSLVFCFDKDRFFLISLVLLSVFFHLSVNNALRQGTSTVFILFSFFFMFKRKYFKFFLLSIIAFGFHFSSVFFVFLIFVLFLFYNFLLNKFSRISIGFGFVFFALLSTLLLYLTVGLTGYRNYTNYVSPEGMDRISLGVKIIPIFIFFILTEVVLKFKSISFSIDYIRYLRLFFVFFLFLLSLFNFFDEIGARILFFYFGLEMLFIMYLAQFNKYNAIWIIVFSYSFAINVWNILQGS